MLSFHTALIMIRRARVSATRKLFFSPDNTAANRGSCPVCRFLQALPQHELGKVFTTEHGVAPGEVRPHVLLDHRYPRIFPVASGRACRRSQCHRVFHRSYVGQGIGLHFHAPNLCHE